MTGGDELFVRAGLVIPADELHVSTSRAGGPGGQAVNKIESRVTLRWSVRDSRVLGDVWRARLLQKLASKLTNDGELVVHAASERSQLQNKEDARTRLAELVAAALHVPKARKKTKPTRGSQRRRLASKAKRADVKSRRRDPGHHDE